MGTEVLLAFLTKEKGAEGHGTCQEAQGGQKEDRGFRATLDYIVREMAGGGGRLLKIKCTCFPRHQNFFTSHVKT